MIAAAMSDADGGRGCPKESPETDSSTRPRRKIDPQCQSRMWGPEGSLGQGLATFGFLKVWYHRVTRFKEESPKSKFVFQRVPDSAC